MPVLGAILSLSVTLSVALGFQAMAAEPLPVVVTNSILGDFARQVGGDDIALTVLVGPGGDPHTFEPSPRDVQAIRQAQIFIENGLGLEPWADKLFRSAGGSARRVVAAQGIDVIAAACADHDHDHDHGDHHHDADPHVWNDVTNAKILVTNIQKAFSSAAPHQAQRFSDRSSAYQQTLDALDAWIFKTLEPIPESKRFLVTNHDVFRYFARRYRFQILGDALGSVTSEAGDPSASRMAALVRAIRENGVPVIFPDFTSNPNLVERVAHEAGIKVGPKLFVDSLGPPGSGGETYETMMRHNVSAMVRALAPSPSP